jgi:hypothetical protein
VFPGSLAAPSHNEEVTSAEVEVLGPTSTPGAQEKSAGRAQRDDGDHGVPGAATADPVPVPGDAVRTVSVETQSDGAKQFA